MIELRRIEAARDIASTLSKSRNVVYLPNSGNMLLGGWAGGRFWRVCEFGVLFEA